MNKLINYFKNKSKFERIFFSIVVLSFILAFILPYYTSNGKTYISGFKYFFFGFISDFVVLSIPGAWLFLPALMLSYVFSYVQKFFFSFFFVCLSGVLSLYTLLAVLSTAKTFSFMKLKLSYAFQIFIILIFINFLFSVVRLGRQLFFKSNKEDKEVVKIPFFKKYRKTVIFFSLIFGVYLVCKFVDRNAVNGQHIRTYRDGLVGDQITLSQPLLSFSYPKGTGCRGRLACIYKADEELIVTKNSCSNCLYESEAIVGTKVTLKEKGETFTIVDSFFLESTSMISRSLSSPMKYLIFKDSLGKTYEIPKFYMDSITEKKGHSDVTKDIEKAKNSFNDKGSYTLISCTRNHEPYTTYKKERPQRRARYLRSMGPFVSLKLGSIINSFKISNKVKARNFFQVKQWGNFSLDCSEVTFTTFESFLLVNYYYHTWSIYPHSNYFIENDQFCYLDRDRKRCWEIINREINFKTILQFTDKEILEFVDKNTPVFNSRKR